jgi:hypothetical protein
MTQYMTKRCPISFPAFVDTLSKSIITGTSTSLPGGVQQGGGSLALRLESK